MMQGRRIILYAPDMTARASTLQSRVIAAGRGVSGVLVCRFRKWRCKIYAFLPVPWMRGVKLFEN